MAIAKRQTISSVIYLTLLLCFSPADALAQSAPGGEWTKPFTPDRHTVVLYHFDEGEGNETHDARKGIAHWSGHACLVQIV